MVGTRARVVLGEREHPITAYCGGPRSVRWSGRRRAVGRGPCRLGDRRHAAAAERNRFGDGRAGLGAGGEDPGHGSSLAW